MNWDLDRRRPVIPQIVSILSVGIANGTYPKGSRLPSVREIALSASVNPNTVQRALEELQRKGLIRSERSIGWFVCEGSEQAMGEVEETAKRYTEEYIGHMRKLGFGIRAIMERIGRYED